jgi:serine/threonine protein kinase
MYSLLFIRLVTLLYKPNALRFYGICFKDNYQYIVTEFCNGGDLKSLLENSPKKFDWVSLVKMYVILFSFQYKISIDICLKGQYKLLPEWPIFILGIYVIEI